MAATQLSFSLRTSGNAKTVHLLGSWDGYKGQLPLSKDPAKAGGWKGTFRFQGATLKPGSRYWYYYIIDGYHVSHDPGKTHTIEPTTGRKLNILDVPVSTAPAPNIRTVAPSSTRASGKHRRHISIDIPKGRALSPSKIRSPHPYKPNQTRQVISEQYSPEQIAALSNYLARQQLADSSSEEESDSDVDSDVPSLTSSASRSSNSSSPSSVSSTSSCCTCERYGITRSGQRVKLDCGGARCGSPSDEGSSCSSDSDDGYRVRTTRRQGIVVRG